MLKDVPFGKSGDKRGGTYRRPPKDVGKSGRGLGLGNGKLLGRRSAIFLAGGRASGPQFFPGTASLRRFPVLRRGERLRRRWLSELEHGLFDDRVVINTSYSRNRSSNQLINYALPEITGFASVTKIIIYQLQNQMNQILAFPN